MTEFDEDDALTLDQWTEKYTEAARKAVVADARRLDDEAREEYQAFTPPDDEVDR